ncbi:hypothetical protein Acr_21g0006950 [Actinidia rufa]|uniref:Uncharacterized protein n=1 Tax=Actinidia rufa TaxID=165716 RepID=A0A7J0GH15_9ERIC|nr:hypothetical protein Acr_21g0006950 [Actinidia rufa]
MSFTTMRSTAWPRTGVDPVRALSGYGWISKETGEEMRERKFHAKHGRIAPDGEEIRTHPNPGASPAAKRGVTVLKYDPYLQLTSVASQLGHILVLD